MRATFYILQTIPNIRLGKFMLENPTLFLIMHLCIKMRLLALGNQLMLNFLKKTPTASNEHNISFKTFDASYVLTNKSGKVVANLLEENTRAQRLVFGYPRCLFLTSKDLRLFGYLRTRPKIVF
jgi:hypothetical protein